MMSAQTVLLEPAKHSGIADSFALSDLLDGQALVNQRLKSITIDRPLRSMPVSSHSSQSMLLQPVAHRGWMPTGDLAYRVEGKLPTQAFLQEPLVHAETMAAESDRKFL
jgi:hypothetical protein